MGVGVGMDGYIQMARTDASRRVGLASSCGFPFGKGRDGVAC